MIDKNSYIPLSKQLADFIRSRIINGVYPLGFKLPSQMSFAKSLDVSRITVSQAFSDLCNQGILKSFKGKGTFVKKVPQENPITHTVRGLTRDHGMSPADIETKVLSIDEHSRNPKVLELMQITDQDYCIKIQRLRIINRVKASVELSYLNPNLFPKVEWQAVIKDNISLYSFLQENFSIFVFKAEETIAATLPTVEQQRLMGILPTQPILSIKRLTYSKNHFSPFEYCEYVMLSDFFGKSTYISL